ncbi:MAG: diguanylate cyclase [Pseudomonadota bacterium]
MRLFTGLLLAITLALHVHASEPLRGPDLDYLVDVDGQLTPAEVLAAEGWDSKDDAVPSFGFRDEVFWFRLALDNPDVVPSERLIEILYPMLDQVDLYLLRGDEIIGPWRTGDAAPFDQRPVAHRNLVVPIELGPGENLLLMRVETTGVMQMPIKVWMPLDFVQYDEIQSMVEGAYFGIMIVMILYNLFLFLSLREARYFYYVCHVGVSTLFLATMHGLANRYLWPDAIWWQERAVPTLVALSVVFICLFVTSFLGIKRDSKAGRWFQGLIAAASITTVLSLFVPYEVSLRVAGLLSIVSLASSLAVSIRGWVVGEPSARYLVFAWGAFVLGCIALALNKFGVLPSVPLTEQGMLIGSVVDVVLLSIALADRVREERALREQAQQHALAVEHAAREELEQAVDDRTRELNDAMVQLQAANEQLEQLSNVDGLTSVHNRRFFDNMLEEHWTASEQEDSDLSLILFDVDHFKQVNDIHGHLLGDECLKAIAGCIHEVMAPHDHVLARYGGEEFAAILPGVDGNRAAELAEAVRVAVAKLKIRFEDREISVKISAGVAGRKDRVDSAIQLVNWADHALYQAKETGRNRICRYG